MSTTRGRWGFIVIRSLLFKKARNEKQYSLEHEIWPSTNLRYSRKECQNSKCMNYPLNACQWIKIKWWFHGSLEIVFIHNSNIPYSASSCQRSSKKWTTKFDSPYHKIFGSQYHVFKTSKCLAKFSSHWSYNQYCGWTMPMASSKAQWRKWLSNSLINWVVAPINQY